MKFINRRQAITCIASFFNGRPAGAHTPAKPAYIWLAMGEVLLGGVRRPLRQAGRLAGRHLSSDNGKCWRLDFLIRLQRAIKLLCKYGQRGVHVVGRGGARQREGRGGVKEYAH